MKFKTSSSKLYEKGGFYILKMIVPPECADQINKLCEHESPKNVEIKKHSGDRSLSANAYSWVLIDQMAKKLTIPKGDMYVKMIKRYGKFESIILKSVAVETFIRNWDLANTEVEHTESLCEVTNGWVKNGTKWVEINCHYGSSTYDKSEFSIYVNGVVSDCEILEIQTMTPQEINGLMANYEGGI